MRDIINKTILNVIDDFISNPFRPLEETRKHHERILHYLHHDFFIKNTTDPKYAEYLFRWEFPTFQRYKTRKTKELYEDEHGEPGYIDVVIKEPNKKNQEIDYGFEYGLFECDKTERAFKIKLENDIRKLINPVNKIKNKYIICFFRCKDFERANAANVRNRIDSVKTRSKKFSEIMFEICRNSKTDTLNAIFVEIFLINQQIKCEIRSFPIKENDDLIKGLCKNSKEYKTQTFGNPQEIK